MMNLTGWGYYLNTEETFFTVGSKINLSSLNLELDLLADSFFEAFYLFKIRLFFLSLLICSLILPATVYGFTGFLPLLMIPFTTLLFGLGLIWGYFWKTMTDVDWLLTDIELLQLSLERILEDEASLILSSEHGEEEALLTRLFSSLIELLLGSLRLEI